MKRKSALSKVTSAVGEQKVCNTRRVASAISELRTLCNVRGDVQYQNDHICSRRRGGLV